MKFPASLLHCKAQYDARLDCKFKQGNLGYLSAAASGTAMWLMCMNLSYAYELTLFSAHPGFQTTRQKQAIVRYCLNLLKIKIKRRNENKYIKYNSYQEESMEA